MEQINEATCFEATEDQDVIIYTDGGDQEPIKVSFYRLQDLVCTCMDAMVGETGRR